MKKRLRFAALFASSSSNVKNAPNSSIDRGVRFYEQTLANCCRLHRLLHPAALVGRLQQSLASDTRRGHLNGIEDFFNLLRSKQPAL